jgi:hypothetical protein
VERGRARAVRRDAAAALGRRQPAVGRGGGREARRLHGAHQVLPRRDDHHLRDRAVGAGPRGRPARRPRRRRVRLQAPRRPPHRLGRDRRQPRLAPGGAAHRLHRRGDLPRRRQPARPLARLLDRRDAPRRPPRPRRPAPALRHVEAAGRVLLLAAAGPGDRRRRAAPAGAARIGPRRPREIVRRRADAAVHDRAARLHEGRRRRVARVHPQAPGGGGDGPVRPRRRQRPLQRQHAAVAQGARRGRGRVPRGAVGAGPRLDDRRAQAREPPRLRGARPGADRMAGRGRQRGLAARRREGRVHRRGRPAPDGRVDSWVGSLFPEDLG